MSSLLYGVAEEIYNLSDRSFVDDSGYILTPGQLRPYYRRRSSQSMSEPVSIDESTPLSEEITNLGSGFQVRMNVPHYKPNELSIRTVDNHLVIEAKHKERADEHGYISRQFTRRYALPDEFDAELVTSTLTPSGILIVKVAAPPRSFMQSDKFVMKNKRRNSEPPKFGQLSKDDPNKK